MQLMSDALLQLTTLAATPEAEASPNLFAGQIWQSIAAILAFLILLALLTKYAWGPIINGLQQREGKIRNDLESAEQARRDADQRLAQYKAQLAEARKEAQQIIEQSRGEAQKIADQLKAQTQAELQQLRQRAQREIQAAKEEAVADVYERTAELSTHIAGRILQREISADDQKALVESSLNELARAEQGAGAAEQQSVSGQA